MSTKQDYFFFFFKKFTLSPLMAIGVMDIEHKDQINEIKLGRLKWKILNLRDQNEQKKSKIQESKI